MTKTLTPSEGQAEKFKRVVEDAAKRAAKLALEKVKADSDGWQLVLANGDELANAIAEITVKKTQELSVLNQFTDEEVPSSYGYLSGYKKPIEITGQIDILRAYWPDLNPDKAIAYMRDVYPTLQLPSWVEGPFALIRPGFFSNKYGEELEEVLKALKKARNGKFVNYCEGKIGPEHLIQTDESLVAMAYIIARQPDSDIIIVPEQFGIGHRGRSVRRAGVYIKNTPLEFGEGSKNIGTMILTHPNRLARFDDLWMDCPGDRYRPDADGDFCYAPYFSFNGGHVKFDTDRINYCHDSYGSASGALPECPEV